ncbi:STAS domain-containing protein [Aldersonia sp. NBC_00410]|uniref:STAS domain-containing protein n=1 Tax=Aldersonia sp. NBC_00410 TaxID=2975954 RepID=UPI0022543C85|nr:STAS domain-containing protein [Aldersonia sp. NBC_00410]MCX5044097.1 STAS domain-containing protein [Aldersonia sp. NBC_00410]
MLEPTNDYHSTADPDPGPGAGGCEITTTVRDNIVVLGVSGTLDMMTAPQLTESIQHELRNQPAAVIVDLTDVEFLASAGMTVLLTAHGQIGESAQFAVVADGPAVARPMHLIGVDKILMLHTTLDAALQASAVT